MSTGHYKVTLKVNGIKGDFIVDTGASTSCIGLHSATVFLLKSEKSDIKAAGAGAIDMETEITKENELKIGDTTLKKQEFILFNLTHVNAALNQVEEPSVDGILGADLLKKLRAVIDYGRNCIYIK
ncbi:retropepsin-like aspartic protease [Aureisphaera galaxeae]|uniref:retropepsin-like aspartic protease family protein n=1 Tax=Aureisphaera galaxeae TaxID=1538023 RepID=UPI0023502DBB|nr:retropepsin-like aspartic protease [Aureisphaera galaxeae]MDC8005926.1 retropepsin-like aspartic protease [Aureisphaera galaxeae]